ncbi:hypothetical protein [Microvirga sp. VF16]|uniref:hypothetical protein n=1 Tax=Microvirga sp. VF16 TaxID=2807101 RepID=UPI00193E4BBB|nr:hypothetical protein [Microvirga sp. VF16]QRM33465.1 hypothetical protein JO965_36080 [Microvirga sp. VF16]
MSIVDFGRDVGLLLNHGLRREASFSREAKEAYGRIFSDRDKQKAFEEVTRGMGLEIIPGALRNSISFVPSDVTSPFAMKLEEVRRRMGSGKDGQVRTQILGFVLMATVAAFYPTRESISHGSVNSVREQDVFDMISKLVEFAKQDASGSEADRVTTLAYEIDGMSDRGTTDGRHTAYRDYYVRASLRLLVDVKYVQERKDDGTGETTYVATTLLRQIVSTRINGSTLQMSEILNRYYDAVEMSSEA